MAESIAKSMAESIWPKAYGQKHSRKHMDGQKHMAESIWPQALVT